MNTYAAGRFCPSDRMIQLENNWADLDEIWCGRYAIGDCYDNVLYNFLQAVILAWRTSKFVKWDRH
jgi:hypothetical protein